VAGQAPETETEVVATGAAVWVVAALALVGEGSVVEEGMALATETVAEEKVVARAVVRTAEVAMVVAMETAVVKEAALGGR